MRPAAASNASIGMPAHFAAAASSPASRRPPGANPGCAINPMRAPSASSANRASLSSNTSCQWVTVPPVPAAVGRGVATLSCSASGSID